MVLWKKCYKKMLAESKALAREEAIRMKELDLKLQEEEIKRRETFHKQWTEHEHNWHEGVQKYNEELAKLNSDIENKKKTLEAIKTYRSEAFEQKDAEIAHLKSVITALIETIKVLKPDTAITVNK